MTKAAAAIVHGKGSRRHEILEPARPRPGWVPDLVVAVLAAANQPLRPQEVIHQAERVRGHRIAPSSIRNCLREGADRPDSAIERLGYGSYRLRRDIA